MTFTILTLFPDLIEAVCSYSIVKRAKEAGHVSIQTVNIRDFATDKYKTVDDRPFGGGRGMILKVDIVDRALQFAKQAHHTNNAPEHPTTPSVILLDPRGKRYNQSIAKHLAHNYQHIILLCGHYEGIDERIRTLVDETISIGDYILTGGEIAAAAIIDSVTRLLPGVLPDGVAETESFEDGLEYPQYTRPRTYNTLTIPDILRSGNHKAIEVWRKEQARAITKIHRPDLSAS